MPKKILDVTICLDLSYQGFYSPEWYFFLPCHENEVTEKAKAAVTKAYKDDRANFAWSVNAGAKSSWKEWYKMLKGILGQKPKAMTKRDPHFDTQIAISELEKLATKKYADGRLSFDGFVIEIIHRNSRKQQGSKTKKIDVGICFDFLEYHALNLVETCCFCMPFPKNKRPDNIEGNSEKILKKAGRNGLAVYGWAYKRQDVKKPLNWQDWGDFVEKILSVKLVPSQQRTEYFEVHIAIKEIEAMSEKKGSEGKLHINGKTVKLFYCDIWEENAKKKAKLQGSQVESYVRTEDDDF